MNRKGFTLIEIIISITLIVIIGGSSIFVVEHNKKVQENKKLETLHTDFDNALEVYLSNHNEIVANVNNYVDGAVVTLEALKNEGLIDDNIIDPTTNEKIDYKKNYYVIADAVLLAEGESPSEGACTNEVKIGVFESWNLTNYNDKFYICPKDYEDLKKRMEELETNFDNTKESIQNELGNLSDRLTKVESSVAQNNSNSGFKAGTVVKGSNPNNWVYLEVKAKDNEWVWWPETDTNLWRIVNVDENGSLKLIYSQLVGTNNKMNYKTECSYYKDGGVSKDYESDKYCKLKHNFPETYPDVYYQYGSDNSWTYLEVFSETINDVGSKKSILYSSIKEPYKSWLVQSSYYTDYTSPSSMSYSSTSNLYMGTINLNDFNNSRGVNGSWLVMNDNMLIGRYYYTKNFPYHDYRNVYLRNGSAEAGYTLDKAIRCSNSNCTRDKTSSSHIDVGGVTYRPVIVLKNQVKLVDNTTCSSGAVQGSKDCPYKLTCDGC